jgi:hypothetical protein
MTSKIAKRCQHAKRRTRRLKVLVKGKVASLYLCWWQYAAILLCVRLLAAGHDTGLLVVADTLLEEIGLAGQGNVLHEVEGVGGVVRLRVAESKEQTVSHKLNVLAHEGGVHAEQSAWQSVTEKLLLDFNSFGDDGFDGVLAWSCVEEREEEAGEVGVHTLVTRDELVGEGQTRHKTAFLQPEDGGEGAGEENTLNGSESDKTSGKCTVLVGDPSQSPFGLLADARDYDALARIIEHISWCDLLFSMALKRYLRCLGSLMYVSINRE